MKMRRWMVAVVVAMVIAPVMGQSPNWYNIKGTVNSSLKIGPPVSALTLTNSSGTLSLSGGLTANGAVSLGTSVGAFTATGVITSSVSTGTAPLAIASTTKVTNLNADAVDGIAMNSGSVGGIVYQSGSAEWNVSSAGISGYFPKSNVGGTLSWTGLASAHLFVGNGSGIPTDVAVTGDVTISNTGVTAIGSSKVVSAMINDGTITDADLDPASLGRHLPRPVTQAGSESGNEITVLIDVYSTDGTTFQSDGVPVLLNISDTNLDMETVTANTITTTFMNGKVFNTITANKKFMLVLTGGGNVKVSFAGAGTMYFNFIMGAKTYSVTLAFS